MFKRWVSLMFVFCLVIAAAPADDMLKPLPLQIAVPEGFEGDPADVINGTFLEAGAAWDDPGTLRWEDEALHVSFNLVNILPEFGEADWGLDIFHMGPEGDSRQTELVLLRSKPAIFAFKLWKAISCIPSPSSRSSENRSSNRTGEYRSAIGFWFECPVFRARISVRPNRGNPDPGFPLVLRLDSKKRHLSRGKKVRD